MKRPTKDNWVTVPNPITLLALELGVIPQRTGLKGAHREPENNIFRLLRTTYNYYTPPGTVPALR